MRTYAIFPLLCFLLLLGCRTPDDDTTTLLLRHVNIIDVEEGSILEDRRVFIKDSLIVHLEKDDELAFLSVAQQLDTEGQFLIPGLWDMHVHMCWAETIDRLFAKAFLHYGITGVRDMGGSLDLLNDYRERIRKEPILGPAIIGCGPFLDGRPPLQADFSIALDSSVNIRTCLDSLALAGSDFLKVYSMLGERELTRIAKVADELDLDFAGHLSEKIEPEIAVDLGQASIEHLNRLEELWPEDSLRLWDIAGLMRRRGTYLCPTSILYHRKASMSDHDRLERPADEGFIPPVLRAEWEASRRRRLQESSSLEGQEQLKARFREQQELIIALQRAGIPLLAGSDFAGIAYVYPGYGLHEELQLLVEAGLSPLEALQTATVHPATYLKMEERYGSIGAGKYADLVLLKYNPLENISHTLSIQAVIRRGQLVPFGDRTK